MNKYLLVPALLTAILLPATAFAQFDSNLHYGSTGTDVTALQEFLTQQNVYSGPITGNFYSLTLAAVKKFQSAEGITPVSGYVGPITRGVINQILATQVSGSEGNATTTKPAADLSSPQNPTSSTSWSSGVPKSVILPNGAVLQFNSDGTVASYTAPKPATISESVTPTNTNTTPATTATTQTTQSPATPKPLYNEVQKVGLVMRLYPNETNTLNSAVFLNGYGTPSPNLHVKIIGYNRDNVADYSADKWTDSGGLIEKLNFKITYDVLNRPVRYYKFFINYDDANRTELFTFPLIFASTPAPTPTADTNPPTISDVQIKNITINSATVSWKTDEPSSAKLEFGTNSSLVQSQTISQVDFGTTRSIDLSNLQTGTDYFLRITARDESGNETRTDIKTFATVAIGTLSVSLSAQNPSAQSVVGGSKNVKVLEFKLQASNEEDIEVTKLAIEVAKTDNGSQCSFLSNVVAKAGGNTLTSFPLPDIGAATAPLASTLVITAGSSETIAIFADIDNSGTQCTKNFKFGVYYNYPGAPYWDNSYQGKYNIGATGKISGQKILTGAITPLYGNVITIIQ